MFSTAKLTLAMMMVMKLMKKKKMMKPAPTTQAR
jgi:hypothetical protein